MRAIGYIGAMGLAAGLGAMPAAAQFRDGQPPMAAEASDRAGQPLTMAPPPRDVDAGAVATSRFASRYRQMRSPRVVIFWNRAFTDEVSSEYEDHGSIDSHSEARASGEQRDYVGYRSAVREANADASADHSVSWRAGRSRVDGGRGDAMHDRAVDLDIEQAFTDALRGAGVRLVDRASIMRRAGRGVGGGDTNVQAIESAAVARSADLILEVVQIADARKRDGVVYRIVVRDVANDSVRASLNSAGRPPARRMGYVAGESGFVRAVAPEPGPSAIGRQLAVETMSALSTAL